MVLVVIHYGEFLKLDLGLKLKILSIEFGGDQYI